jgi:hypothetical protein
MVRTVIHTMGGTIPGLGTAMVPMDIRTIVDQSIETKPTRPSTDGARILFYLITLQALKTQAVSSRAA